MFSSLLKRAIPFTLTFIIGAGVGGFFKLFRSGETRSVGVFTSRRAYEYGYGYGHGCDHRRSLVAESKPLVILFKPDARWPRELREKTQGGEGLVLASVTFGADGKVQDVNPSGPVPNEIVPSIWRAAERAARQIQFEPETVNGVPVTVTKEVIIHFMAEE
jgi:hypothetical protein